MDFLRNRKIPRLNRANNAAKKASLAGGFVCYISFQPPEIS